MQIPLTIFKKLMVLIDLLPPIFTFYVYIYAYEVSSSLF